MKNTERSEVILSLASVGFSPSIQDAGKYLK